MISYYIAWHMQARLAPILFTGLNQIQPAGPALPGFRLVTTPTRSSGKPSTCSASATASGPRSQQRTRRHPETAGKRHHAQITGGTSA